MHELKANAHHQMLPKQWHFRFGGKGFIENPSDVFYNEKKRTPELPTLSSSAVLLKNYFRDYSTWIAFTKDNYFQ